ncbi:unnamed protein product [Merluccius merluccius]
MYRTTAVTSHTVRSLLAAAVPTIKDTSSAAARGKGPLKNSSDVINAAKKIAEAGSRMDKLARAVADQALSSRRSGFSVGLRPFRRTQKVSSEGPFELEARGGAA